LLLILVRVLVVFSLLLLLLLLLLDDNGMSDEMEETFGSYDAGRWTHVGLMVIRSTGLWTW